MAKKALPCPTLLRQLLRYEPDTGKLFWRERPAWMFTRHQDALMWSAKFSGKEALASATRGYKAGRVLAKGCFAHRAIWAIIKGYWPTNSIDHIDGDGSNNRINNLRDVSQLENTQNTRSRKGSSSRYLGVSWKSRDRKWVAHICVKGKRKYLGCFTCEISAARAYDEAARENFGPYANPNFP